MSAGSTERLSYIDGLRGVAVGMVLLYHAWYSHFPATANPFVAPEHDLAVLYRQPSLIALMQTIFDFLARDGGQGVSLFLVISGFCLALPPLRRRATGQDRWFIPSQFFARRCLRILPPYYLALGLFVLLSLWLGSSGSRWVAPLGPSGASVLDPPPNLANLIAHLLLIHNMTPYSQAIDGPMWSLGMEWQWYFVFPILLGLCLRSFRLTIVGCLGLAMGWTVLLHRALPGALPPRLFEFCAGVVVAYAVVHHRRIPNWALLLGIVLPFGFVHVTEARPLPLLSPVQAIIGPWGLSQPLWGVAFAALLLLGSQSRLLDAMLSWRPLVWLGIASYSIYLMHQPFMKAVEYLAPPTFRFTPAIMLGGILAGIGAGTLFYVIAERPVLQRHIRTRYEPVIATAFRRIGLLLRVRLV